MKNVVICADGTNNAFDRDMLNVSNVVRLVRSLALDDPDSQIVFYDQGVGTDSRSVNEARRFARASGRCGLKILEAPKTAWWSSGLVARIAGLGFGYGLKANVREMYAALAEHVTDPETTRVYLFGFSRGAFTVRALAGFVHRCGLLPQNQLQHFDTAFDTFYEERHREAMGPKQRRDFDSRLDTFKAAHGSRKCRIHFLGIWDTVKSYGFIYPKSLPHLRHNPSVDVVRHALALGERRSNYQFTSWGGVDHPLYDDHRQGDITKVEEVWFAGRHSDVGGGKPDPGNGLARWPFIWMLREAAAHGLRLDETSLALVMREFDYEVGLHDSLEGGWWLTELLPRFELENIPMPGRRVLKWGSTGHRDPLTVARGSRVKVHASAHRAYAQAGLTLHDSQIETVTAHDLP